MTQRQTLSYRELKEIAREVRIDIIRMLAEAGSGHPGGSLSAVEIVVSLFYQIMRHDPKRPDWPHRDRFVLSKGHACPVLYATLARLGYFPREELMTLRKLGSRLQGHPDPAALPFLEAATGALGQGLSVAIGMALASKLEKNAWHTYCLMGDGETQEGQVWEAAMSAPKFKLDNLTAIIDYNKGQIDGHTWEVMDLEPIADKWRAFNWKVLTIDGHDFQKVIAAFKEARTIKERPTMIIAHTVKGKGVSFMENVIAWHGKAPSKEEAEKAIQELKDQKEEG
ncbi:MAG: transketolase [Candidatus Omnitrophica bacterium]|nr:transketolase [Candidatus Omnitrophota bacterium]